MTDIGDTQFSTPEMSAAFSGRSLVARMLEFEAALARAQARAGLIAGAGAEAIASRCKVDLFDVDALYRDAALAGTPAIPLVKMLTERVEGDGRRFVHWGATSQDAIDTAMMLQIRDGLRLLTGRLLDVAGACAALAERHRRTPMAGRTLMQHAVPITFGLKAARWLAHVTRLVERLRELQARAVVVQLGGAAGTLAALGTDGVHVMELLARELNLGTPDLPWHTERDRMAEIASALGLVAGAMAKVAADISLLTQTEVGEVTGTSTDTAGRSSTMPHKRNPVEITAARASAHLALGVVPTVLAAGVQEHERAAGGWQAEWQAVPDLFRFTAASIEWVHRSLEHLEVDTGRMRTNLDLTGGLILAEALTMALARTLGRPEAYRIVQRLSDRAAQTGTHLRELAASDEQVRGALAPDTLQQVFDVSAYLGSTDELIDRALAAYRTIRTP